MMPVIRIDDATFAGLSTLKTWFGTKTPSDTIERVVKEAMDQLGFERDDEPDTEVVVSQSGAIEFTEAPGLTFTKPLAASLYAARRVMSGTFLPSRQDRLKEVL